MFLFTLHTDQGLLSTALGLVHHGVLPRKKTERGKGKSAIICWVSWCKNARLKRQFGTCNCCITQPSYLNRKFFFLKLFVCFIYLVLKHPFDSRLSTSRTYMVMKKYKNIKCKYKLSKINILFSRMGSPPISSSSPVLWKWYCPVFLWFWLKDCWIFLHHST